MQAAGIKGETKLGGWSTEETKKFDAAWKGKGLPNAKDDAVKTELVTMIRRLSNNKELEDLFVKDHDEVKDYLSKGNLKQRPASPASPRTVTQSSGSPKVWVWTTNHARTASVKKVC